MTLRLVKAFIAGSSIAATFITVFYVGGAFRRAGRPKNIPFEQFVLLIPVLYGLANVFNVLMGNTVASAAIAGALLGTVLSFGGRFGFDLPVRLFGFTKQTEWRVHLLAVALYVGIFVVLVRAVNRVALAP